MDADFVAEHLLDGLDVGAGRDCQRRRGMPQRVRVRRTMPKTPATVDQQQHHAHIRVTDSQSVRLGQATSGKWVTPQST